MVCSKTPSDPSSRGRKNVRGVEKKECEVVEKRVSVMEEKTFFRKILHSSLFTLHFFPYLCPRFNKERCSSG